MICGLIGIPPSNGVIPQSPMHTKSLATLKHQVSHPKPPIRNLSTTKANCFVNDPRAYPPLTVEPASQFNCVLYLPDCCFTYGIILFIYSNNLFCSYYAVDL